MDHISRCDYLNRNFDGPNEQRGDLHWGEVSQKPVGTSCVFSPIIITNHILGTVGKCQGPWNIFGVSFWFILNFPHWKHSSHTAGNTAKCIVGTFFGKIPGFPMDHLIRTLQSHDLELCKCTGHLLHW